MKKRRTVTRESIVQSLELPQDLYLGHPLFTMDGNGSLYIENHKGIIEYSDESMVIRAKGFLIRIHGKELWIQRYDSDALLICGRIEKIELAT